MNVNPCTSQTEKTDFVKGFIEDPVGTYKKIQLRMKSGDNPGLTPMPEFEPVVRFLQDELIAEDVIDYCKGNSFAQAQRDACLMHLAHIDLDFIVDVETCGIHQHQPPATGRFPYLPTLQAIDHAVTFFDSFERARKAGHDTHYQTNRYLYHGMNLPHLSDWIVAPTADVLTLTDLIAVRSAPIGLTMVASRTEYIDAYFNSPLNADTHDDNHNRRFRSENQGYFAREGITTDEEKMKAYEHFDDIIKNKILPAIKIEASMSEEEKNIRKAMTVLYFEWLHEYAKTPDRKTLIHELQFLPDGPSAFEIMMREGETPSDVEARRLGNKNIESGVIEWTGGNSGASVYYFMDKGRNFITSAFNKVCNGFYDNPEGHYSTDSEFPDKEHRTVAIFTTAIKRIMDIHDVNAIQIGMSDERIEALLENKTAGGIIAGGNLETYPAHHPEHPLNKAPRIVDDPRYSDAICQGFQLDGTGHRGPRFTV